MNGQMIASWDISQKPQKREDVMVVRDIFCTMACYLDCWYTLGCC